MTVPWLGKGEKNHYKQIRGKESIAIGCPEVGTQIIIETQGTPLNCVIVCPLCGRILPQAQEGEK